MCSGTTSLGNSTMPSGNSGNRSSVSPIAGEATGGAIRLRGARRDEQVVEDRRWQRALEQRVVDHLQREVAAVRVLVPRARDRVRVGRGLERAVGPAEPAGEQLLSADAHRLE